VKLVVTKLWVRSFNMDHLDVFWEIGQVPASTKSDTTPHAIFDFEFFILRSEAAMGPYEQVGGPLQDLYHFRDVRVSLLHKWRQWFYKLKIVDKKTGDVEEIGPASSFEPEPDIIAAEIIRQEDMLFREFVGRRCWLFPVRTFGPRCTCYDPTLQRATRSGHLPCFGTGWLGGYMRPVEIFIQLDPTSKQSVIQPTGEMQPVNTTARMSSFPPVSPRDIIIESENRRWRVVNVGQTQRLRAVVHQELQLHEIPKSDVEYSIPLNVDERNVRPSAERNFTNAQNIEKHGDNSDILSFWGGKARGTIR
jgi:hypothetical protein